MKDTSMIVSGHPFGKDVPPLSFHPLTRPFDRDRLRDALELFDPVFGKHVLSALVTIHRYEVSEGGPVLEAKAFRWSDVPEDVKIEITQGAHGAWPVVILLKQASGGWWYPSNKNVSAIDLWSEFVPDSTIGLLADLHDAIHITMRREDLSKFFDLASEPEATVRIDWWTQEEDAFWLRAEVRLQGGFDWWLCSGPWKTDAIRFTVPTDLIGFERRGDEIILKGAAEDLVLSPLKADAKGCGEEASLPVDIAP